MKSHLLTALLKSYIENNWTSNAVAGARGSVVGRGTMLQDGRSRVRFPIKSLEFFNLRNSFSLTEPVTETSTRNPPGG
jgi:hypothetical protein